MTTWSPSSFPVLELRQYTLHPGQRDVLIDLFERELVETQEELGMRVVGSFRDLDDPDRFVWLRGFAGMSSRRAGLTAFYGGPVWAAHKAAANATMIDSDDVLLLRPVFPEAGFATDRTARPPVGSTHRPQSLVTATLFSLPHPVDDDFRSFFCDQVDPLLTEAGAPPPRPPGDGTGPKHLSGTSGPPRRAHRRPAESPRVARRPRRAPRAAAAMQRLGGRGAARSPSSHHELTPTATPPTHRQVPASMSARCPSRASMASCPATCA